MNQLYVSDSGTGTVMTFEVDADDIASSPEEFANVGEMGSGMGVSDGMVTDEAGNLYTTGTQELIIFDENGDQLHLIEINEQITNLGWGGEDSSDLYITGSDHVYRYTMNAIGSKKQAVKPSTSSTVDCFFRLSSWCGSEPGTRQTTDGLDAYALICPKSSDEELSRLSIAVYANQRFYSTFSSVSINTSTKRSICS